MLRKLWAKILLFVSLFSVRPVFSQERDLSELKDRLVSNIDMMMDLEGASPDYFHNLDSAWQEAKVGLTDSVLLEWVSRMSSVMASHGQHSLVANLLGTAENYFLLLPGDERYSYLMVVKTALGSVYEEMGLWTRAMNLYFDVLELRELSHRDDSYGSVLNNIGNVYFKQGYYDKAHVYYDSAIAFNARKGEKKELVNNYNNLAGLYYMEGDYARTLMALNQALAQIDKEKDPDMYYLVWQNIAVVYNRQGKRSVALELVKEALHYYEMSHRNLDKIQAYLLLATLYPQSSDSALHYMEAALHQAREVHNHAAEISALQALYGWHKAVGDYHEACNILERTVWLQDSLEAMDNRMKIESIEATNAMEQENSSKDLALQQMQIERLQSQKQELLLIGVLLCLVIALGVMYYRYRLQKKLKRESDDLAVQRQAFFDKEKKMMAQREQELRDSLELKNKELTSKVLHLIRNNEFIVDINRELQQLLLELNPKDTAKKEHIREMLVKLRDQGNEGTYAEFKYYFEQVHQSFYENLQKAYPSLTYKDIRLCSFLKLGLSSKEIASITFKEVRSVESARNRLRKKMNLDADVNLIEFFSKFSLSCIQLFDLCYPCRGHGRLAGVLPGFVAILRAEKERLAF